MKRKSTVRKFYKYLEAQLETVGAMREGKERKKKKKKKRRRRKKREEEQDPYCGPLSIRRHCASHPAPSFQHQLGEAPDTASGQNEELMNV
jgi:hypothetical protein